MGVGGCVHPDELWERLTTEQWAGWQLFVKHFQTPMRRADLNSALERQAMLAPYAGRGRVPTVSDLLPKYGAGDGRSRKSAAKVFEAAQAVMGAAHAHQAADAKRRRNGR